MQTGFPSDFPKCIADPPREGSGRARISGGGGSSSKVSTASGIGRRIETSWTGEVVHIAVKKLARIPAGGGHKKLGREARTGSVVHRGLGYTHIHTAIDAYSRLACSEFAGQENTVNCVAFLERAVAWFADRGIAIERILTDNGNGYRSRK